VAINERLYRFDAAILKGAPANAGVYTLWQDGEMIYLGHSGSIKTSLLEHLEGRAACTTSATHYSWELSLRPAERESELLAEFRQRHGRPPRCNGKAA
jgi:ABC-type phosphate/phosphonate transport system ATPase subunit